MDQAEFRKMQSLLEPPQTPEELDIYLRTWLKLDLPWHSVDEDSTSSSLKFIWDVYKTMLTGEGATRHVLASARNSAKTLSSAAIQFLSLLIFRREGNHISATLEQSAALTRYIDNFMNIPELTEYKNTDNVRRKEFLKLPPNDYTKIKTSAALQIITASRKGANSSRANTLTADEIELTDQRVTREAAMVIDPTRDEHKRDPIIIYLSSRKTADGPIQELIEPVTLHYLFQMNLHFAPEASPLELHKIQLIFSHLLRLHLGDGIFHDPE
jgi:hypothetical protein